MSRPATARPNGLPRNPRSRTGWISGRSASASSAVTRWMVGAHQRDPDRAPLEDRVGQLDRLEAGQPRPQPDVRRQRCLRLETDEVLDRGHRRHRASLEQELAGEERPVQGTLGEHRSHASR